MKERLNKQIGFDLVNATPVLSLHNLVKLFQEAAINHSRNLGTDSKGEFLKGRVWILYQYGIEVERWPVYDEQIEVVTWHREMNRFKAYREFEVYSGGHKIAAACGVYILFDMKGKKITRVPEGTAKIYPMEKQRGLSRDLDQWRPVLKFDPDFEVEVTTRQSDFDLMGHVNNAVYFDFIETALAHRLDREARIMDINICYAREINSAVTRFYTVLSKDAGRFRFRIYSGSTVFAYGDFSID